LTDQLHLIAVEADGGCEINPFNAWEKSALYMARERLVCFIDRPGSKISQQPLRHRFDYLCWRLGGGGRPNTTRATMRDDQQGVSPTGVEHKDAGGINAIRRLGVPKNGVARYKPPGPDELLFERPLLGDNATWHQSQPQRRDCTQSKDS
jgi:hypothetical protein